MSKSKLTSTKLSFENLESDEEYRRRSELHKRQLKQETRRLNNQLGDLYAVVVVANP